jgi:hypothetical protein
MAEKYPFPGRAEDLAAGHYWRRTEKKHSESGSQSLGYDLTAVRFDDAKKKWTALKPGFDSGDTNESSLIHGTPVYAIADGEVFRCWRNAPENPRPGEKHAKLSKMPGGGNELWVELENGNRILYAHFQTGTVPSSLCPIEKEFFEDSSEATLPENKRPKVKKGQFIGKVGNSGQSSGPHLHIHIQTKDKAPIALPFYGVWTKSTEVQKDSPQDWLRQKDKPLPPGPIAILPDYGKGFSEIARHGVPASDYQLTFDHIAGSGYRLVWVNGYEVNGKNFFNVIFHPEDGVPWVARHGLTSSEYQEEFDKRIPQGFRPLQVESYPDGNKIRYAVIFVKESGPAWTAYHGKTADEHQKLFDSLTGQGFRPVNVSVVSIGGERSYTALYEKIDVGSFILKSFLTASEYQDEFDKNKAAGRQLAYLNAYTHNGGVRFSAIWNAVTKGEFAARHGLTGFEYQAEWKKWTGKGYLTQVVTGYESGNNAHFAGLWRK